MSLGSIVDSLLNAKWLKDENPDVNVKLYYRCPLLSLFFRIGSLFKAEGKQAFLA